MCSSGHVLSPNTHKPYPQTYLWHHQILPNVYAISYCICSTHQFYLGKNGTVPTSPVISLNYVNKNGTLSIQKSSLLVREPVRSVWLADKLSNTLRFQLLCVFRHMFITLSNVLVNLTSGVSLLHLRDTYVSISKWIFTLLCPFFTT